MKNDKLYAIINKIARLIPLKKKKKNKASISILDSSHIYNELIRWTLFRT